jgi:glutaredoxin-related protein
MKYINFYRENNNFDDILKDANIKKHIKEKTKWLNHLCIGILEKEERIFSYITLKYGDEMRNKLTKDYSPIPNIDYIPKRK